MLAVPTTFSHLTEGGPWRAWIFDVIPSRPVSSTERPRELFGYRNVANKPGAEDEFAGRQATTPLDTHTRSLLYRRTHTCPGLAGDNKECTRVSASHSWYF